jgi:pimeloyl-ACP methyl ester carboxylesterase
VVEVFDVVGFDPRGVGATAPVSCYDSPAMNEYLGFWPDTLDVTGIKEISRRHEDFGEACLANTGPSLEFVDSGSTARDMDLIRAAVGDEKLNYLGISYGTYLGALYAERFPDRVGRLVLDAAVDPAADSGDEEVTQLAGFEAAIGAYVADCLAATDICPLSGTPAEATAQIHDFIAARQTEPLPTDFDRPLTTQEALMGIMVALYEDATWPMLHSALGSAMELGDGTELLQLADLYFDRDSDGEFTTNMFDAFIAISCLDSPVDARFAELNERLAQAREVAPTFADFSAFGALSCAEWPFPAALEPHAITAEGAAPIVVIGTTGDPATPIENAHALAGGLASGVLVTFEGEGHGAVGRSNSCVTDMLVAYYREDTPPAAGLTC